MLATVSPIYHTDLFLSSSERSYSPSVSSSIGRSYTSDTDLDFDMEFPEDQEDARSMMIPAFAPSLPSQSPSMPSQQMMYVPSSAPPPSGPPPSGQPSSGQSWLSLSPFPQHQPCYHGSIPSNHTYPPCTTDAFPLGGAVIPHTSEENNPPSLYDVLPSQPPPDYLEAPVSHPVSFSGNESMRTSLSSSISRSSSPSKLTYTVPPASLPSNLSPPLHASFSPRGNLSPQIPTTEYATNPNSLYSYGIPLQQTSIGAPQSWRCAYPECSSRAVFTRGCDLRKHYNRHSKHLFCRFKGCPQSAPGPTDASPQQSPPPATSDKNGKAKQGRLTLAASRSNSGPGFSSKKDRARHEAKHNPKILCEWVSRDGQRCSRRFSRVDNMKDHVRRIHSKASHEARHTSTATESFPLGGGDTSTTGLFVQLDAEIPIDSENRDEMIE